MKKICNIIFYVVSVINAISCIVLLLIFPRVINHENLGFDYMGVLVGILSLLVTLLIGWNIYQLVDFKDRAKDMEQFKQSQTEALNYMHNKADYNQAMVYALMCQNASTYFAPNEENVTKFQMLSKGLAALKLFSNIPKCEIEISSLMNTLIKGMANSASVHLDEKAKGELLIMCGEIKNKDKMPQFDFLVELIQKGQDENIPVIH